MPGGEIPKSPLVNRNQATMFFTVAPKPDIEESMAAAAYARAFAHLASLPHTAADKHGYRLFWARGEDVGHKDLFQQEHAVVGRHTVCDIALSSAHELSLRHLLVAPVKKDDGGCALRVLDLHASLPFFTDDGQPRRSIVATGPVVLRLGTYLFGGVPIGPDIERSLLPDQMPTGVASSSLMSEASARTGHDVTPSELSTIMGEDDPYEQGEGSSESSFDAKTLSPLLTVRSQVIDAPKVSFLTEMLPLSAQRAYARLTLERDGHSASLDLDKTDLDAGVLIGRSERCTDKGLRRVLDGNISRVHVLLLRDGDDVVVFDLCSTQGIYADGQPVRRFRFSRAGGAISLARTNPVTLRLHARSGDSEPAPTGNLREPGS